MRLKSFIIVCALAMLPVTTARAGLSFSMTPSAQSGLLNNEILLIGTLTNTSLTTNIFLNGVQITLTDSATNHLAADTNAFFANVPGILLPGEIYKDAVFAIAVKAAAHASNYSGTVTIQGGADISSTNDLATQTFQVTVPPAAVGMISSGTNLVILWPSPPTGFVLQENSSLSSTNWLTVTNASVFTNGQNQIVLPRTTNNQFYRLQYP